MFTTRRVRRISIDPLFQNRHQTPTVEEAMIRRFSAASARWCNAEIALVEQDRGSRVKRKLQGRSRALRPSLPARRDGGNCCRRRLAPSAPRVVPEMGMVRSPSSCSARAVARATGNIPKRHARPHLVVILNTRTSHQTAFPAWTRHLLHQQKRQALNQRAVRSQALHYPRPHSAHDEGRRVAQAPRPAWQCSSPGICGQVGIARNPR